MDILRIRWNLGVLNFWSKIILNRNNENVTTIFLCIYHKTHVETYVSI